MKKEKIIKYGTMGSYLLLYVIVAIVSLISSIHFFNLAHQGWMSTVLACSFEIGQMACLFGALTRRKKGFDIVWIMFVILTLFQCMANTYAAYVGLTEYTSWSELFGLTDMEVMDQKRIIAGISGAILPLIALGFIKCLTDYLNNNERENTEQEVEPKIEPEVIPENTQETVDDIKPEPKKTEETTETKKTDTRKPNEFNGYVVSDDDIKKMEEYGKNGIGSTKKNMEEILNKLKGYTKTDD
jgi:hypothetical protein